VRRYPKAILVENNWTGFGYNQGHYQKVVLQRARQLPGEKVLLTLDADELLTADAIADFGLWAKLDSAPQGTPIFGSWVNIRQGFKEGFNFGGEFLVGAVDGPSVSTHEGKHHVPRLKVDQRLTPLSIAPFRVMHYQFTDLARYRSKQRFYAVVEQVERNGQRPYDLYRRLHPYETNTAKSLYPLEAKWTEGYEEAGIDWKKVSVEGLYRWDESVVRAIAEHGPLAFRKLDIWDHDWLKEAHARGLSRPHLPFQDPRSRFDKLACGVLRTTQPSAHTFFDRVLRQFFRLVGY